MYRALDRTRQFRGFGVLLRNCRGGGPVTRGRKPTPRPIEVPPDGKPVAPPSWLGSFARAEWKKVAPILHSRRVLTPESLATLASYCVATGTVRELEDTLSEHGWFARGRAHPAFNMQAVAMREARLLAVELGLTPRSRKSAPEVASPDEWSGDLLA